MTTVEPIRNKDEIKKVEKILAHQSQRGLVLFTLGINSGLRISDILALNVGDVRMKTYIQLVEKKTGKTKKIPINAILKYTEQLENMKVSFIVYDYEKNKKLYTAKYMYTGEKITETRNCLECKTCKYCTKNYQNNNVDFFELLERKQLERGKQENE